MEGAYVATYVHGGTCRVSSSLEMQETVWGRSYDPPYSPPRSKSSVEWRYYGGYTVPTVGQANPPMPGKNGPVKVSSNDLWRVYLVIFRASLSEPHIDHDIGPRVE